MSGITNEPRLTVDLRAIKCNYALLAKKYSSTKIAAIVKSDAYGLEQLTVARALADAGCTVFFVVYLYEAIELRRHLGYDRDIFVLYADIDSVDKYEEFNLIPVLNTQSSVRKWISHAKGHRRRLPVAIKVNSGMNRLGLSEVDLQTIVSIHGDSPLDIRYVISHLACGRKVDRMNDDQLHLFNHLSDQYFPGIPKSIAASNILTLPEYFSMSMIRCGLNLYGAFSPDELSPNPLLFAIKLEARVLQLLNVRTGDSVGYNKGFVAKKDTSIATLAIGYADGVPSSAGYGRFKIRLGQTMLPIIGEISMNLTSIDVSDLDPDVIKEDLWLSIIADNDDMYRLAQATKISMHELMVRLGCIRNKVFLD